MGPLRLRRALVAGYERAILETVAAVTVPADHRFSNPNLGDRKSGNEPKHHREDLSVPQPLMFAKYDNPGLEPLAEEIEPIETLPI